MNRLRRSFLVLAAAPWVARAQTPAYAPGTRKRIGGIRMGDKPSPESRRHTNPALAALGWVEGQTLDHVARYAEGDATRLDHLARQLVAERVDLLLASGVPSTRAMQRATKTIPICAIVDDPVGNGFAKTMARPGGNITGLCEGYAESSEKEVELLKTAVPGIQRLVIFSLGYDAAYLRANSQWLIDAGTKAGIGVDTFYAESWAQVEGLLRTLPPGRSALYLRWTPAKLAERIVKMATARKIALVGQEEELVDYGALMTYRPVIAEDRQLASMLDRLLRGGNPAEIPFELPTRSVFAINRKAAAALGLTLPKDFYVRADKVVG
jgi:putative ABC transport system substrate-binding protein